MPKAPNTEIWSTLELLLLENPLTPIGRTDLEGRFGFTSSEASAIAKVLSNLHGYYMSSMNAQAWSYATSARKRLKEKLSDDKGRGMVYRCAHGAYVYDPSAYMGITGITDNSFPLYQGARSITPASPPKADAPGPVSEAPAMPAPVVEPLRPAPPTPASASAAPPVTSEPSPRFTTTVVTPSSTIKLLARNGEKLVLEMVVDDRAMIVLATIDSIMTKET